METFQIYTPVAKGKPKIDKIEAFANLLGFGSENAIKRSDLVVKCVCAGLIAYNVKDKDRAMRILLEKARREYVILNDGQGQGYYRPTAKELISLARSNQRENSRAIKVFSSTKKAKALEEDYKHGRLDGGD